MRRAASALLPVATGVAALLAWNGLFGAQSVEITFDPTRSPRVRSATLRHEGAAAATLVEARIDGTDVGWLLLDSGAEASLLDSRVAAELDLERTGGGRAGECRVPFALSRGRRLEIGQAIVERPAFATLDLRATGLLEGVETPDGRPVVGLLGAPLFNAAVITVSRHDGEDRVGVHDPSRYSLPEGEWTSVEMRGGHAFVSARLEGDREIRVRLDTGKVGSASFYSGYVEREGLRADRPGELAPNRRLCGTVDEFETRLEWFELAGERFESPRVRFRLEGTGGDDPAWREAALVGQGFLRAFDLVFDQPHSRIAFIPAAGTGAPRH